MNREFNKLDIEQQVKFINSELKKDGKISVTKLCKKFGFNKSTIIDRFNHNGYSYNFDTREYMKKSEALQEYNNCKNEVAVTKLEEIKEFKELKTSLAEIKELLQMKDQIKEVIQEYIKSKTIVEVPEPIELKVDNSKFTGELKARQIKVYKNANDEWIKFCKENSQYKMQDLYSMALLEFIDKYK